MAGESAHSARGRCWRRNRPEVLLAGGVCEDDVPSVRARHREGTRRRSLAIRLGRPDLVGRASAIPIVLYRVAGLRHALPAQPCHMAGAWLWDRIMPLLVSGDNPEGLRGMTLQTCILSAARTVHLWSACGLQDSSLSPA